MDTEDIYAALQDDEAFARLPDLVAHAGGGRSCMMFWRHAEGDIQSFAYNYYTPEFLAGHAKWAHKDVWITAAISSAGLNRVHDANAFVPDAIFERTEIYNEFVRAAGDDTYRCIGGAFNTRWGSGTIGVQRGRSQKGFDAEDLAGLQRVIPHVRRVMSVRAELIAHRREKQAFKDTLDVIGLATITIDREGHIRQANRDAERVLRRGDALMLRGGKLVCTIPGASEKFCRAMMAATVPSGAAASALALPRPHGEPYQISVTPLGALGASTAALIIFRDPDMRDPSLAQRLGALFGLTPREGELAVALTQGQSLGEIAQSWSLRESTVRQYMKSLAAKMQCSRQAEVVTIIARLPLLSTG